MDIVCPVIHERFSVADVNILFCRLDGCPSIPISKHGRLIDAEKLIAELKNPPLHLSLAGMCMDDVIEMINDAPTVIPAEEVKT